MICISARVISPVKMESLLLIVNLPLANMVSTAKGSGSLLLADVAPSVSGLSASSSVVSDEAELLLESGSGVQAGAVFLSVPAL